MPADPFGQYRDAWRRVPEPSPTTTVYRAAPAVEPYFGLGSYWTLSQTFAHLFREWLTDTLGGKYEIYRADVDLTAVHELRGRRLSDVVTACVPQYADEGHRWLSFLERGSHEGVDPALAALVSTERQYVYLGSDAIATVRLSA